MGNCLNGCLPYNGNKMRRSNDSGDSHYEKLVNSATKEEVNKKPSKRKFNFLNKFLKKKDVEYSRLNKKCSNNNIPKAKIRKTGSDIQLQCLDAHSLLLISKDKKSVYHDLTTATSASGSSLDLEWENDCAYNNLWRPHSLEENVSYEHSIAERCPSFSNLEEWTISKKGKDRLNTIKKRDLQSECNQSSNNNNQLNKTSTSSIASYSSSHISTPEDSLEWDADHQLKSENESLDIETKELLLEIEQLKNRVLNETGANLRDIINIDETNS